MLTPAARKRVDRATEAHLENERRILSGLSDAASCGCGLPKA